MASVVVAVVVLSEVGEAGDLSSLNPFSSDRIFVLLELMLLLEDDDDEDELEDAVDEELLLLVFAGYFLIGSSESESLLFSSVAIECEEMSVLFEVRRLDPPPAWPPRVAGRRWPPGADAGDLFRFAEVLGVVERGEIAAVAVVPVEGVVLVISPFELPRARLDVFGVVTGVVEVEVEFAVLDGVLVVEVGVDVLLGLLLLWELDEFLLLFRSDLPFFVLLLVRFSAIRSLRTHSSYLVFHPV